MGVHYGLVDFGVRPAVHQTLLGFGQPESTQAALVVLEVGVALILTIGGLTPPIGVVLYILSSVSGDRFGQVVVAVAPFLIPLIIVLLMISFLPLLTLGLPQLAAV